MQHTIEENLSALTGDGIENRSGSKPAPASLGTQARELAVLLLLIVPSMLLSFFAVNTGTLGFVTTAIATIVRDVGLVALVWLFLWKNGESVESIGLSFRGRGREAVLGGVLYLGLAFVANAVEGLLQAAGLPETSTKLPNFVAAHGNAELVLAVVLVAVVALAEEIVFRGFLIRRITAVTGSCSVAVILSTLLFALGHGYEGTAGVITVGLMGLCFALVYLWRGTLVAPVTMHFILDFISLVLAPLWLAHT